MGATACPIRSPYLMMPSFLAISAVAILWPRGILFFTVMVMSSCLTTSPSARSARQTAILSRGSRIRTFLIRALPYRIPRHSKGATRDRYSRCLPSNIFTSPAVGATSIPRSYVRNRPMRRVENARTASNILLSSYLLGSALNCSMASLLQQLFGNRTVKSLVRWNFTE